RTRPSMQARNAARVFPEPVGAEMRVVWPARMCGQPCSCGSVGVPKRETNHSCTNGWAQAREGGTAEGMGVIVAGFDGFVKRSPYRFRKRGNGCFLVDNNMMMNIMDMNNPNWEECDA